MTAPEGPKTQPLPQQPEDLKGAQLAQMDQLPLTEASADHAAAAAESATNVSMASQQASELNATGRPERRGGRLKRAVIKVGGGLAVAGVAMLGPAAYEAEAATPDTAAAQTQSNESGPDLNTFIGIGTLTTALAGTGLAINSARNQTKQKVEEGFTKATEGIGGLANDATGEQRGARLRALDSYAERRKYRLRVFNTSVEYLRGRRAGVENLRSQYDGDEKGLERALTERRNADRNALNFLEKTLPAARKAIRKQERRSRIRRVGGSDEFHDLAKLTSNQQVEEVSHPRVNLRGINLDDMRGLQHYNFKDVDLTGAGLQRLQLTRDIFKNASLSEVQLKGTIILESDLREADVRAAYLFGATIEKCVIDKDTEFGRLPDDHPKSKLGSLQPDRPDEYRGNGEIVLKDLVSDTLSKEQIVEKVHKWQRNGLKLLGGSNHEYFLRDEDDPNWNPSPPTPAN